MRSDIKRDLKKVGVGIALIGLFFAGRYVYTVFSISGEVPDTDKLLPKDYTLRIEAQDSDEWPPEIQFDFREKRRIGWGKYGFRKKIVLDKKMIFDIYIPEDYDTDSIYYGIYRDAALDEPVGEVDLGELLKEGTYAELDKPSDYFNMPHNAGAVLEPGTYYLAVYTTDPFAEQIIHAYEGWQIEYRTELRLKEKEWKTFFVTNADQEVYFRLGKLRKGKIQVSQRNYLFDGEISLCDEDRDILAKGKKLPAGDKPEKRQTVTFSVPKDGIYYLKAEQLLSEDKYTDIYRFALRYRYV